MEKKCLEWIEKNVFYIAVLASVILSIAIRIALIDFESGDAVNALLPWYNALKEGGGFATLYRQVGDYNMPYQTLLAILTYIPIEPLHAIKLLSIIFDYLLAFSISWLVYLLTDCSRAKAMISLAVSLNFPLFIMNSSLWGQCDSIFSSFCVLTLIFLIKEKDVLAFVFLGLAFSFKLQAVFILPFILFYYLYKKRFSILHFFIIPIVIFVSSLGGIIHGRSLMEIVYIYWGQTQEYPFVSLNYSSLWNMLVYPSLEDTNFKYVAPLAIGLVILVLGWMVAALISKGRKYDNIILLEVAFVMTYACVFMLPSMHERYDYIYVVIGLVLAFTNYRFIPNFLIVSYLSIRCYSAYLFGNSVTNWNLFTIINLISLIYAVVQLYKDIKKTES